MHEGKGRGTEEVKGIYVAAASLFLSITYKNNDHPPTQHMATADGDNWYTNSTSLSSLGPTANNVLYTQEVFHGSVNNVF